MARELETRPSRRQMRPMSHAVAAMPAINIQIANRMFIAAGEVNPNQQ